VLVTVPVRGRGPSTVEVLAEVASILERVEDGRLDCIGVDMPIGLPEQGARACDVEARTRLGPRRSSVFPCPPRGVLGAVDYGEALARSRAIDGRGISRQAFHLLPRIAELDGGLTPALQSRVFECHPESCFVSLAGAPLESKHTAQGREMRCRLLTAVVPDTEALVAGPPRGAGVADVLDAAVVAWTARRWRAGRALVLGDDRRDRRGLRMQIVC
jgi:predicted RNase H-like nuclease